MIVRRDLSIPPEFINDKDFLYKTAADKLELALEEITAVIISRRSIDARRRSPVFVVQADIFIKEFPVEVKEEIYYPSLDNDKEVIIVGSGPAGMFAALRLIELGIKPVIFERGKDVQSRRKDLRAIQQFHTVDPDSNYCFGEGGAGTYSDGKLYTRATKRGDIRKILNVFVYHGADHDILIDAHPHIGSNKLPNIVKAIRQTIIKSGGMIYFNSRVTDLIIKDSEVKGVIVNDLKEHYAKAVILATGHSARDIFHLLHNKNILIEPKPFAMGVRIEHPQKLINEIQYHTKEKSENLPPATYNAACNIGERGVYSFCMCPGGIIVPAATAPGEIVLNGMSLSRRDSPFANSGFVVSVGPKDWIHYEKHYPFSGLMLQKKLEALAFKLGNNSQTAPAQRVTDFVNKKTSSTLPKTSYIPGTVSVALHEALPDFMVFGLRDGIMNFEKKMRGFYSEEAVMLAVESRTSSPIKIPRDQESFMHLQIKGLFPSGEGAGYAGGIVSAAIDGENCANAAAKYIS
ncbi:MAG: NAD(P)/FAD-dependent oxidoreductase [Ignavibacteriaceae bacterium]